MASYTPEEGYQIALERISGTKKSQTILDLSYLNLRELPEEIVQLSNLVSLDISNNEFNFFPKIIGQLNLSQLFVHKNQLPHLPKEIKNLRNLTWLTVGENQLTYLPEELGDLVNLVVLGAGKNQISELPKEIGWLEKLDSLHLPNNNIVTLPKEIIGLVNLTSINLSNNQIGFLPEGFQNLKKLKGLWLDNNPLPISPEILKKGNEPRVILEYYFSQRKEHLNECKVLVVGQGSVGKTSLVQRLVKGKVNQDLSKTQGIDITRWEIESLQYKSDDYRSRTNLNVWDFGGQEIMHATHQFFLTKRSLYLLVLDSRLSQEENRVEYWLKIIQSFGGESPILIVGNKIDQHPFDIDRSGLQKKYPNISGVFEVSATTGQNMQDLRSEITEQIFKLPHVRDLLPKSWFVVKNQLEELGKEKNFIRHDEFLSLCTKNNINEESSQRILIGFMHDLGIVLHYQEDPRLEALGILKPQWVTNGVYKILNSHTLFQNKGKLTISMLNTILDLPEYPRDKRLFIVDMMKKFELCYDIEPDKIFLVPDLLPKDEPFTGEWENALAFQYHYTVLPSSVITRFIVRMNELIYKTVWRSGVILKSGENTALVKADTEDKKVYIWINGAETTRRDFLSAIRGQFEMIHKTITKLEVREKVPVPGQEDIVVDFQHLLTLEQMGMNEYLPEGMKELVSVKQLLNGVSKQEDRQRGGGTVNIHGNVQGSNIVAGNENQAGVKK